MMSRLSWSVGQEAKGRAGTGATVGDRAGLCGRDGDDPLLGSESWWAPLSPIHTEFARARTRPRLAAPGVRSLVPAPDDPPEGRCAQLMA
jgi:hypothetical protein